MECGSLDGVRSAMAWSISREYFQSLRPVFEDPIQLHFEYPEMGGAEDGKRSLSISRDQFRRYAQRDLRRIRELMRKAGMARG